jgi:hypothetical protein
MGQGLAWDWIERQVAAKAYCLQTENNTVGTDQKTSQFQENMFLLCATVHST